MQEECFGDGPFIFRLNDTGTGPHLLTQVFLERGWREFNPDYGDNWNLWWRTTGFSVSHHKNLYAWQYINHIPKGSSICRKDNLIRYLRCMKKIYGSIYNFSPDGFNLPLEYTKLAAECNKTRTVSSTCDDINYYDENPIWICKPVAQSQGRGIFLFRKLSELSYDSNTIVQRYIEKPLLIGGYKFDLRLYVLIPSYFPITIYMYREGIVRFGTDKFTLNDLRNPFRHLTNSSINKLGPGYTEMKDRIGSGCKWTLKQLRRYFQQASISDWLLWQKITSLVILTVLSNASQVPPTINCFEFFGFDVLIDNALRPWLLEVNLSPALGNDCDVDRSVKKPMLHDMLDLLGLPLYNTGLSVFNIWADDVKENRENVDNDDKDNDDDADADDENNSQDNDDIDILGKNRTLNVITAASRWRRRQKKLSVVSRTNSAVRNCKRSPSARQGSANFVKERPKSRTFITPSVYNITHDRVNCMDVHKLRNLEESKRNFFRRWGNGKDWNNPPSREGDWIRIWPINNNINNNNEQLHSTNNNNNNKECHKSTIKSMVAKMVQFNKTIKEIMKEHPGSSECQLNEFLQDLMNIDGDIWLPPI